MAAGRRTVRFNLGPAATSGRHSPAALAASWYPGRYAEKREPNLGLQKAVLSGGVPVVLSKEVPSGAVGLHPSDVLRLSLQSKDNDEQFYYQPQPPPSARVVTFVNDLSHTEAPQKSEPRPEWVKYFKNHRAGRPSPSERYYGHMKLPVDHDQNMYMKKAPIGLIGTGARVQQYREDAIPQMQQHQAEMSGMLQHQNVTSEMETFQREVSGVQQHSVKTLGTQQLYQGDMSGAQQYQAANSGIHAQQYNTGLSGVQQMQTSSAMQQHLTTTQTLQQTITSGMQIHQAMSSGMQQHQTLASGLQQHQALASGSQQLSSAMQMQQALASGVQQHQTMTSGMQTHQTLTSGMQQHQTLTSGLQDHQTASGLHQCRTGSGLLQRRNEIVGLHQHQKTRNDLQGHHSKLNSQYETDRSGVHRCETRSPGVHQYQTRSPGVHQYQTRPSSALRTRTPVQEVHIQDCEYETPEERLEHHLDKHNCLSQLSEPEEFDPEISEVRLFQKKWMQGEEPNLKIQYSTAPHKQLDRRENAAKVSVSQKSFNQSREQQTYSEMSSVQRFQKKFFQGEPLKITSTSSRGILKHQCRQEHNRNMSDTRKSLEKMRLSQQRRPGTPNMHLCQMKRMQEEQGASQCCQDRCLHGTLKHKVGGQEHKTEVLEAQKSVDTRKVFLETQNFLNSQNHQETQDMLETQNTLRSYTSLGTHNIRESHSALDQQEELECMCSCSGVHDEFRQGQDPRFQHLQRQSPCRCTAEKAMTRSNSVRCCCAGRWCHSDRGKCQPVTRSRSCLQPARCYSAKPRNTSRAVCSCSH